MADRKRKKQREARRPPRADEAFVTIAQYGPDDKTVTKVVATVFRHPGDRGGKMTRWVGTGITESPRFRAELLELIKKAEVRQILLTRGVIGCIHEEGKDYPDGEACPICRFWRGRDRWAKADLVIMTLSALGDDKPWPG